MHNPAPVLENDTHKLLRDLKYRQITYKIVDFAVPADRRTKLKEWEEKDTYLDLA